MAATHCRICGDDDMEKGRALCRQCVRSETRIRQKKQRMATGEQAHETGSYFCDPVFSRIKLTPDAIRNALNASKKNYGSTAQKTACVRGRRVGSGKPYGPKRNK